MQGRRLFYRFRPAGNSNAVIVTEDLTNKVVPGPPRSLPVRRSSHRERRATTIYASVVAS
jgi:hypothetical protein